MDLFPVDVLSFPVVQSGRLAPDFLPILTVGGAANCVTRFYGSVTGDRVNRC